MPVSEFVEYTEMRVLLLGTERKYNVNARLGIKNHSRSNDASGGEQHNACVCPIGGRLVQISMGTTMTYLSTEPLQTSTDHLQKQKRKEKMARVAIRTKISSPGNEPTSACTLRKVGRQSGKIRDRICKTTC